MIWSFSDSRTFRACQRQWCFSECVANGNAKKDALRREAYLLSKLQSVYAWRGSLVDRVISEQIVPTLNTRRSMDLDKAIDEARALFAKQLDFAINHRLREPQMSPSKTDGAFAAFHAIEYGLGVNEEEISRAWSDIERALRNLALMSDLVGMLGQAGYLVPQRSLIFQHGKIKVRAVPDLIAFYEDEPPLIVDWKVHTFGVRDYRLQLACYAAALKRCTPHRDFPTLLTRYEAKDIRLLEAQLLTGQVRRYDLSDADIESVDSFISLSSMEMLLALGDVFEGPADPFDFPTAEHPETCQRCSFRSLCWGDKCLTAKQMSFL